jgi:hypothetical protein
MAGSLSAALKQDELVLCLALINSRTSDVPAIAAACGYDAVYVDLEHTTTSVETAGMLCVSALGAGISGLVRVPSQEPTLIARILDGGAVGVIVPHVDSKTEAEGIVDAARFPPLGHRSAAGPNAVSGYAALSLTDMTAALERETVVAVMIESPDGVRATMRVDRDWNCEGLTAAVRKVIETDGSATIDTVVRVPFASLGYSTPIAGESWRANFFRIDRHPTHGDEYSAWQPTHRSPADFHVSAAFGTLRFEE